MRLIDRGLLMYDYLQRIGTKDTYKAKYEALEAAVDNAPTIDAVPVMHARYGFVGPDLSVYRYDTRCGTCSACKERILFRHEHNNYCPNCGARMDGDPHDSGQ